ncbi:hypothetical protein JW933_02550, partial [candidate division FCPU426 bacterium]|nr:hypothetical protein [candidate division FCPU426 bacterium]
RPATVMQMLDLEKDLREGRTSFEKMGFTAEDVQALQQQKQANSKRHPFVRLGNPELFPEEMEMYEEQYRLEHHFFTEGKLGIVSTEHVEDHPFISVSTSLSPYEINDARSDFVPEMMGLIQEGVHPLAALSIQAGEELAGGRKTIPVYMVDEERQMASVSADAQTENPMDVLEKAETDDSAGQAAADTAELNKLPMKFADLVNPAAKPSDENHDQEADDLAGTNPMELLGGIVVAETEAEIDVDDSEEINYSGKKRKVEASVHSELAADDGIAQDSTQPQTDQTSPATATAPVMNNQGQFAEGLQTDVFNAVRDAVPSGEASAPQTNQAFARVDRMAVPGQNTGISPATGTPRLPNLPLPANQPLAQGMQDGLITQGPGGAQIAFLLGQAEQMLGTLPAGESLTYGFDNPELAGLMQEAVAAWKATPGGAILAGRVRIDVLKRDARGMAAIPGNWKNQNGIAVLTAQMNNQQPVTLALDNKGGAVATQLYAIKMDPADAQSFFAGVPGGAEILAASKAQLSTMHNQQDLAGYVLINAANVRRLQQARPGLLSNLLTPVIGFQDAAASQLKLPWSSIRAAGQPSFNAGRQRVTVDINLAALEAVQNAYDSGNVQGVVTFGAMDVLMSSEAGYNANALFLQDFLRSSIVESGPVDMMVDQDALNTYGVRRAGLFNRWFDALKDYVMKLQGEEASRRLTRQKAEDQAEEMSGFCNVNMIMKSNSRLGQHLSRLRGQELPEPPSLLVASDPQYRFKHGRMVENPVLEVKPWKPVAEETILAQQKFAPKILYRILLGFAAGVLLMDMLRALARMRGPNNKPVSVFKVIVQPEFGRAVRRMAAVVLRGQNVVPDLSLPVQQQFQDLQTILKQGQDIDTLLPEQVPGSLNNDIATFRRFKDMLVQGRTGRAFIFKNLMRMFRIKSINPMLPEMYILLNQSKDIRQAAYPLAPAATLRAGFADLRQPYTVMDKTVSFGIPEVLWKNLRRSQKAAQAGLLRNTRRLQELRSAAVPDEKAIAAVNTRIKNFRFSVRLNQALRNLDAHPTPDNTQRLLRVLLREMGRRDLPEAEDYQAGLLAVLGMIDPFQQTAAQVRQDSGRVLQISMPDNLYGTVMRDHMLFFLDVYDTEGKILQPLRRQELRTKASA